VLPLTGSMLPAFKLELNNPILKGLVRTRGLS